MLSYSQIQWKMTSAGVPLLSEVNCVVTVNLSRHPLCLLNQANRVETASVLHTLSLSTSVAHRHSWRTDFRRRLQQLCAGWKPPRYLSLLLSSSLSPRSLCPHIFSLIVIRLLPFSVLLFLPVGSVFLFASFPFLHIFTVDTVSKQ